MISQNVLEPLLKDFDLVIGSRFLDKTNNHVPSYRKSRDEKYLIQRHPLQGLKKVTDTQSGYRSYGKKKAIEVIQKPGQWYVCRFRNSNSIM